MCDLKFLMLLFTYCFVFIEAYRTFELNGIQKIFAKQHETVKIVCQDNVPLARCGFTHSNGTKILFLDLHPGTPQCELQINLRNEDEGMWTCHIWPQLNPHKETKKFMEINIVNKFAAINTEIVASEGERVTLSCVTTETMIPLNHCYFTTPNNERVHMNDKITSENVIMDRFYFPVNKSLIRGDCGVTIDGVTRRDSGIWYCNGWIELENMEYRGFIHLTVKADRYLIEDPGLLTAAGSAEDNTTIKTVYVLTSLFIFSSFVVLAVLFWKRVDLFNFKYKTLTSYGVTREV